MNHFAVHLKLTQHCKSTTLQIHTHAHTYTHTHKLGLLSISNSHKSNVYHSPLKGGALSPHLGGKQIRLDGIGASSCQKAIRL